MGLPPTMISQAAADRFPKKSVLTPIGALAVSIFGICAFGAVAKWPSSLSWALLVVGVIPLFVALWAYVFFALRDPDRLQTEDYRIQREYIARLVGSNEFDDERLPRPDARLITRVPSEAD